MREECECRQHRFCHGRLGLAGNVRHGLGQLVEQSFVAAQDRACEQAAVGGGPVDGNADIASGGIDNPGIGLQSRPGGAESMGDLGLFVGDMLAAGKLQKRVELGGILPAHRFDLGFI